MAVNVDLLSQELPAHASSAIDTTPKAFELQWGGMITITSPDVAFRVWFSDAEDASIPAAAFAFAIGATPEYSLRGAPQKKYCLVATDTGAGTAKLIQE
tara:strand:+ start:931 stop:1227 length:297 start_codon:yes stop_codon:yes gene_type:complete